MSWHDESKEETAPNRDAFSGADEATNLVGHVPDEIRRSASIMLGDEAAAEDMTAPTRVRDDELRAALTHAQTRPAQPAQHPHHAPRAQQPGRRARPAHQVTQPRPQQRAPQPQAPARRPAPVTEEATEVNVVKTSDLDAIIRGQVPGHPAHRPNPAHPAHQASGPSRPDPRQAYTGQTPQQARPAPGRARPMGARAPGLAHNPFSEDEPTQANVVRDSDLRSALASSPQQTGPPPAGAPNPFGPPQPYDAHSAAPQAQAMQQPRPQVPQAPYGGVPLAERTDLTRPKPRQRHDDDPVGLATEVSWSSHVDNSPIARPVSGPPTGFAPAIKGPTHHPGAPMQRVEVSNDSLIRQQLADSMRPLTLDERDAITNNMLMIGVAASFVGAFFLYLLDFSVLLILVLFAVLVGGMGGISRKFPNPCESFLNVLSINVRKE